MEVPGGKDNKLSVCLHEAFGTMLLLLAINMGAASGNIAESACITIFVAFVLTGSTSGGHLNPAVTMGVTLVYGSMEQWMFPIQIILSQLAGATLGCLISLLNVDTSDVKNHPVKLAKLCPSGETTGEVDLALCTPDG